MQPLTFSLIFVLYPLKMYRFLIFFLIIFLVSKGSAQETFQKSLETFHKLRVDGPVDVRLVKGTGHLVKVETKGFPSGKVDINVSGTTLHIELEGSVFRNNSKVDVWVTYQELDEIEASGAANIFGSEPVDSKSLELETSTAATIEIEVITDQLSVHASTAGQIIVSGKTGLIDLECSTSANVDAYRLVADEVKAEVRTAASCKVNVLKEIEAEVSTAGSLRYRGTPDRSNLQSATGGSIRKVD